MPRRTKSAPVDEHQLLCELGDRLRGQFGKVRYIRETFHNGRQWTIRECWEKFEVDEETWVELDWTDIGGMHSAHC